MIQVIVTAHAALLAEAAPAGTGTGGQSASPLGNPMIFMVLMMVLMYFVIFRPQRKKQKETEALQKAISPGDEVVTIGGAHGVVTTVKETTIVVRMQEGKIEFDRSAIARKVPKEEPKAAEEKK